MNATTRMRGDVLLVGSMPFDDAETVFRETARGLKGHLGCMPDGEVGPRKNWVGMLPEFVFSKDPLLQVVSAPAGGELSQPELEEGEHIQESVGFWTFKLKPGVSPRFDNLLYADFAIESYAEFQRLRDQSVIEAGTCFQVCLPAPDSAIDAFFTDTSEWPALHKAYQTGLRREIARILDAVPAHDLVIQFDMAWEVVDLAMGEANYFAFWPKESFEQKYKRHTACLDELWRDIPNETLLGYHWCYGTWGGWPMTDMKDLELCVQLSNEAVKRAGRRVDYVHMPVVQDPDDSFFAPLDGLKIGDTKVYLGVVHEDEKSIEPFRKRMQGARRHLRDFGIGGVCGYGRIDPKDLPEVLRVHTACAEELSKLG
jgi:hypothetical protein